MNGMECVDAMVVRVSPSLITVGVQSRREGVEMIMHVNSVSREEDVSDFIIDIIVIIVLKLCLRGGLDDLGL